MRDHLPAHGSVQVKNVADTIHFMTPKKQVINLAQPPRSGSETSATAARVRPGAQDHLQIDETDKSACPATARSTGSVVSQPRPSPFGEPLAATIWASQLRSRS